MTESSASTGANPTESKTLAERFASVTESDYVRDVLAVVLLAVSLALPATFTSPDTPGFDGLYLAAVAIAALALVFPYASRFGLLSASWTVARTRSLRLVLALPFALLYVWYAVGAYVTTDSAPLGVGSAFAVGGAGVALAAQARHSELGPAGTDKGAGKTARLIALVLATLIAVGFIATAVYLLWALDLNGSGLILLLVLVLCGGVVVAVPALAAATKQTRAWSTFLAGIGIAVVAFLYLTAKDASSVVPKFESFQLWGPQTVIPLSLSIGYGLFLVPALAAVVTSPAFLRNAKRATDLEERLDLAAIVLRVMVLVGAAHAVTHLSYAVLSPTRSIRFIQEGFTAENIAAGAAGLVVVVVALVALRSFNRNPGTARAPISIALVLSLVLALVLNSLSPFDGKTFGQLLLLVALPAIGAYALIGNRASREYFAQASKSRPEPSTASYIWSAQPVTPALKQAQKPAAPIARSSVRSSNAGSANPVTEPAVTGAVSAQTGHVEVTSQDAPQGAQSAPEFAAPAPQAGSTSEPESAALQPEPVRSNYAPAASEETAIIPAATDRAVEPAPVVNTHSPAEPYAPVDTRNTYAPQNSQTEIIARPDLSGPQEIPGHGYTEVQAADPATPAIVLAKIAEVAPELRPALALNPSTYPALVDWLGQLGDPAINSALARRQ